MNTSHFPNPAEVVAMGRMTILHNEGKVLLNDMPLSASQMSGLIFLGAVRQRAMLQEGSSYLQCRSSDFEHGVPSPGFPRAESNFPEWKIESVLAEPSEYLDCGSCAFKDWKADPSAPTRQIKPPCRVQIACPILVPNEDDDSYSLAYQTFSKSAEPPITEYMKTFVKNNKPAYTAVTRLRLDINLGKGFKYSVPKFSAVSDTPVELYPTFSLLLRVAKGILQAPPQRQKPRASGGMLSVAVEAVNPTYSGGFFG